MLRYFELHTPPLLSYISLSFCFRLFLPLWTRFQLVHFDQNREILYCMEVTLCNEGGWATDKYSNVQKLNFSFPILNRILRLVSKPFYKNFIRYSFEITFEWLLCLNAVIKPSMKSYILSLYFPSTAKNNPKNVIILIQFSTLDSLEFRCIMIAWLILMAYQLV